MLDNQITYCTMLAWLGWVVAIGLTALDLFVNSNDIGHAGILFAMASSMIQLRAWMLNSLRNQRRVLLALESERVTPLR